MSETLNPQALAPRLAQDIAAGAISDEVRRQLDAPIRRATFIWQPSDADMADRRHVAVMRYWQALPKTDGVADVLTVDAAKLATALGYLILVEMTDGGTRFRYRVYGSAVAQITNFDMTGRWIDDTPTTPSTMCLMMASYFAVCRRKLPLYTVHEAPANITINHWHRLVLPLGTAGTVERFLVCMIPVRDVAAQRAAAAGAAAQPE